MGSNATAPLWWGRLVDPLCGEISRWSSVRMDLIHSSDFIGDDLISTLLGAARRAKDDKPVAAWSKKLLDRLGDYEIESRLLVRLADTGRVIQLLKRGIDTSLHILNIYSTKTRDEWYGVLENEREMRMDFYDRLLANGEDFMVEVEDEDQQLEVLTLLKHGIREFGSVLTPRELDTISAVFDALVLRSNLIIGRLPTWFVVSPPDGARRSSIYDGEEACLRQAAALSTLHNPHVRKFYGGCHVGSPFVLHETDQPGLFKWSFFSDCALGLDYIHRRGFVHKEWKDETLRYSKEAKRGMLSGMRLMKIHDRKNENDSYHALQADVASFGMVIFSALARSRGYSSLARGSDLPYDKPAFVSEEEWSLLLSFGTVNSPSELVKRMRDLDKTQRIEERLQQEYFGGESVQSLEVPVDDITSFIFCSSGRTIANVLQDADELCDQIEEFAQVNRCVYDRLLDLYKQLVAYAEPLPAQLVEDYSLIVWDFYRKLEKRSDPFCSASSMCLSRTIGNRNYSLQQDIDKLMASGSGILSSSELHRWISPHKLLRYTSMKTLAPLTEGTTKCSSDMESDEVDDKADTDTSLLPLPTWFIPVEEVSRKAAIDSGAFGAVYVAKWLGADVVVKQVLTDQTKQMYRDQFYQEADLWFTLNHKNLLQLYGANHINYPFFVCEHAIGKTLPEFLKRERGERMHDCILHAALGLENLHGRGVVHGDLKGNNILVWLAHETDLNSAVTKLADFGLSIFVDGVNSSFYEGALGAFQWKAPECLLGHAPTCASDIFSLGMCFLEAATGAYPWGKIPDSVVRENVTVRKVLPPRPKGLTDSLWALVNKMCCFDPQNRINASAVVNTLGNGAFEGGTPLQLDGNTRSRYPLDRTRSISPATRKPDRPNRWHRSNRPKKVTRTQDRLGDYLVALRNDFVLNYPVCRRGLNLSGQLSSYESETRVLLKLAMTGHVVDILLRFGRVVESYVEVMGIEKTAEILQWRDQLSSERQERLYQFQRILSDEQGLLEAMGDEAQQMELLTILKHDTAAYHNILTPEELDVMSDVYDEVVRHSGITLVEDPPSWFLSPNDLLPENGVCYLHAVRVSKCMTGEALRTGSGNLATWEEEEEACLRQATVWADLNHPHVAKMLGACHIGKNPFVVHELAEPLVPNHVNAQSWEPLLGWALGLQYLHERELGYKNFDNTRLLTRPHVTVNGVLTGLGLVPIERQTSALLIRRAVDTFSMDALSALLPQASADDDVLELNSPTWSVPNDIFAFGLAIYNTRQWKSSSGDEKLLVLPQERPDFLSECEWDLVNKMCARIPDRRVTICYVVHQLQQFVRAPAWSYAVDSRESLDPLPSEAHEVLPNSVDSCIVRKMSLTVARAIPFLERRCREMLETIGSMPQHVFDRLAVLRAQIQSRVNIEEATSVTNGFVYVLDLFYDRLIRQNAGTEQLSSNVVASFCASRAAGQNIVILHREIDRLLVLAEIPPTSASSPTPAPRGGIHDAQDVHDWQLRWNKDRREQLRAFQTYLENTEELKRQLSDPKSRMEAQVLLQFELHKHRSSYPNSVLEAMSQALSVLDTMGGSAEVVPCWFIPPYEVVLGKHIAQGGFVDVYYGEWLNTEVVVKILKPQAPESLSAKPASPPASSSGSSDDDAIELFRREADHWFTLNHQNVVHLYGACHVGTPFFVCEPAKSTSLNSHVKELACARPGYNYDKSGGDSAGIMQCLNQAGIGLKYLHERGLIHCDLKRNTFMVGTDAETIKLGDFGKSALAHSGHGRHPAHANVGTIPWKAPECLKGEEPTVMSDVYSFGMCILELLSGKYPWAGVPQAAVKFHVTKRKALPPRSKELTDLQWSLIQHMCCYEPSERISLDAVVDMLYTFRFEQ